MKFAFRAHVPAAALLVGLLAAAPIRAASSSASDLAPAEALVFLNLPDPVRTVKTWRGTELFKLWSEPEVRAFLERPLARVPLNPMLQDVVARLGKIEPREMFVAVVPRGEKLVETRLVAGFRFDPKRRAELDGLLERPKAGLRASFPGGTVESADHRGQPLEVFRTGRNDELLATATRETDGWYLLSNDLDLLRAAVDRLIDGPKPERPALGTEDDFRAVRARLGGDVESLAFARPAALVALIPEAANIPASQRERLRGVRAVGAVTAFVPGGLIRDAVFALMPDLPAPAAGPLDLPALGLGTAADTVFFSSARLPGGRSSTGSGGALGGALGGMLAGRGVTPERFSAAFGEEVGAVFQWTDGADGTPAGAVAVPVKDRTAAEEVLGKLVAVPFQEARWERRALPSPGGVLPETPAYVLSHTAGIPLTPTLVLGNRFLFLAGSLESARVALDRERDARPGAEALAGSEPYRAAVAGAGPMPDQSFAYLDWRRLFERAYATARPMLAVSALVMPKFTEFVDVDRLPAAGTVGRHLSPATLTQRGTSDGILLESVGPLPLTQAAGLSVLGLYLGAFSGASRASNHGGPGTGKKAPAAETSASPH